MKDEFVPGERDAGNPMLEECAAMALGSALPAGHAQAHCLQPRAQKEFDLNRWLPSRIRYMFKRDTHLCPFFWRVRIKPIPKGIHTHVRVFKESSPFGWL